MHINKKDRFRLFTRYVVICVVLVIPLVYFLLYYGRIPYSIDNTRYLTSVLIQSQVTVLAIVSSLTLVGIQLSVQKYTPRLVRMFIQDRPFWELVFLYVLTIALGCCALYILPENPYINNYTFQISLGNIVLNINVLFGMLASYYVLAIASFYLLIPYTKYVMNMLKPENIAERITDTIRVSDIERYSFRKDQEIHNPLASIRDFCMNAIDTYDEDTLIKCTELLRELFERSHSNFLHKYPILRKPLPYDHLNERDREIVEAYTNMVTLFEHTLLQLFTYGIKRELYNASIKFISVLGKMGKLTTSTIGIAITTLNILHILKIIDNKVLSEAIKVKEDYKYLPPPEIYKLVTGPILSLKDIAIQGIRSLKYAPDHIRDVLDGVLLFIREAVNTAYKHGCELINPLDPEMGSERLFLVVEILYNMADEIIKHMDSLNEEYGTSRSAILRPYLLYLEQIISIIKQAMKVSIKYRWEKQLRYSIHHLWSLVLKLYDKNCDRNHDKLATEALYIIRNILIEGYDFTYYLIKDIVRTMEDKIKEHIDTCKDALNYGFVIHVVEILVSLYEFVSKEEDYPPDLIIGVPQSLGSIAVKLIKNCKGEKALTIVDVIVEKLSSFCNLVKQKEDGLWQKLLEEGVRWLIYLGVSLLQKGEKDKARAVADEIRERIKVHKDYISRILDDIDNKGNYGICMPIDVERNKLTPIPIEDYCKDIILSSREREYFTEFKNMILV